MGVHLTKIDTHINLLTKNFEPHVFMAYVWLFRLIVIFSSYLCMAAALESIVHFPANTTTTWTNNDNSISQPISFSDGSSARFILLKRTESCDVQDSRFGFGVCFYRTLPGADSWYLSIVLLKMSSDVILERTPEVVWSANRDTPVGENANLSFSNKILFLADANGSKVWSTNTSHEFVSGMRIDVNGNMVLFNQIGATLWQSFDHPTDTLLLGQKLRAWQRVTSRISTENMSCGMFCLSISSTNTLDAFVKGYPMPYLILTPTRSTSPNKLKFVQYKKGKIEFIFQLPDKIQKLSLLIPKSESLQFMRLDDDGGLRVYVWNPGEGWTKFQTILDQYKNECWLPLKCGRYGVCRREAYMDWCTCPVGVDGKEYFTPIDSKYPYHGCHQNTHSLVQGTSDEYQLVNVGHLAYFSYHPALIEFLVGISEESCKQICMQRPSCKASFFLLPENSTSIGHCYMPSEILSIIGTPLQNGFHTSAHIKIQTHISSTQVSSSHPRKRVILATFSGVLAVLVLIIVCLLILQKKKSFRWKQQDHLKQVSDILIRFSYSELSVATARFSVTLGRGGFGTVFKGLLSDGTIVAVKRLENFGQGVKEFLAEVDTIGQIHHINLVRLIGFCVEKGHRMLVYEYMSRGSLDKWIFHGNKDLSLDWKTRKKIVLDAAKGLAYIHEDCRQRIAHLDIKPHNILLDDNFNAKLSDFGMSKLISRDQSQVITGIRGTLGYLAPEWQHSVVTVKADIYSFGIVLLEVVCGRKNLDYSQPDSSIHLLSILQKKSLENRLMDIVDCQSEDLQQHVEEAVYMIRLGMWCLNEDYTRRPSMSLVVKILEGAVQLDRNMTHSFPSTVIPIANAVSGTLL